MEYLFCSIFLFIFFWVITILISLVALHLKYLKYLKEKQLLNTWLAEKL
jgi:putative effector of murein hydrolase